MEMTFEKKVEMSVKRENTKIASQMPLFAGCEEIFTNFEEQEKRKKHNYAVADLYTKRLKKFDLWQHDRGMEMEKEAIELFGQKALDYRDYILKVLPDLYKLAWAGNLADCWFNFLRDRGKEEKWKRKMDECPFCQKPYEIIRGRPPLCDLCDRELNKHGFKGVK